MIEVDLSGPQGNAYFLLAQAKKWAKELDLDWDKIQAEAKSGDYGKLVATMRKYFGEVAEFNNGPNGE